MANDIQLKRSSVPGRVPDVGNVLVGEPVVNLADQIIFTKDGGGNIIVIGAGTTSNVTEGVNLYFSNTRARSAVSAGNGLHYSEVTGEFTTGLVVQLVDEANVASVTVANVSTLQFDSGAGFDVLDRANGIVKVQMNSTFKTWNIMGQANVVAEGLDTMHLITGNNISITTNPTAPKSITIGVNDSPTFTGNVTTSANLKAAVYLDNSNRRLLIKDAAGTVVWGE